MSRYQLTWITPQLAVGYAPMSYAELDSIRTQGIHCIVNLCGEFSDLHTIEEQAGFEVCFLPIPDECAPKMDQLEQGLAWMDDVIYLGKKVLVHCHHGIGRTGTFVTAYLLRRGFGLKQAEKKLKNFRPRPTNFSQWWLLKKFGRKEGVLKTRPAKITNREKIDLSDFFEQYLKLRQQAETATAEKMQFPSCTLQQNIGLVESLCLQQDLDRELSWQKREQLRTRAGRTNPSRDCILSEINCCRKSVTASFCPLSCLLKTSNLEEGEKASLENKLRELSNRVASLLFGSEIRDLPKVPIADVVSGRFMETYFNHIRALKKGRDTPQH